MAGSDTNPPAGASVSSPATPSSPSSLAQFREVCETHLDFVWRFAASRGVEASALEHVVHRVFAIVHNHLLVLQQTPDVRLAIARVARNVVRRHLRRMEAQLGVDPAPERSGPGPFDQVASEALAQKSTAELVDLILSQMSGPEREVFVLVEVERFSAIEAAQVLRLDERTLDERLEEARKVFNVMSAQLRAQQFWISRGGVDTR